MTFTAVYRGHDLTQAQLDAMTVVLNESLNGKHRGQKKFNAAFEAKCVELGCPIPEGIGPKGPDPVRKRSR